MDHIKNLLSQTGWSYEELLQKLNEFKNTSPVNADFNSCDSQAHSKNIEGEPSRQKIKPCIAGTGSTEAHQGLDDGKEKEGQEKFTKSDSGATQTLCQANGGQDKKSEQECETTTTVQAHQQDEDGSESQHENKSEAQEVNNDHEEESAQCSPCHVNSSVTQTLCQSVSEQEKDTQQEYKVTTQVQNVSKNKDESDSQQEPEILSSNTLGAQQVNNIVSRHEFEKCLPGDINSSTKQTLCESNGEQDIKTTTLLHDVSKDEGENTDRQEVKKHPSSLLGVDEKSDSQQEVEKCLPCDIDSSTAPAFLQANIEVAKECQHQAKNEDENKAQKEDTSLSLVAHHQVSSDEESDTRQELEKCLPCDFDSSAAQTPPRSNGEQENATQQILNTITIQENHQSKDETENREVTKHQLRLSAVALDHVDNEEEKEGRRELEKCELDSSAKPTLPQSNGEQEENNQQMLSSTIIPENHQSKDEVESSDQHELKECPSSLLGVSNDVEKVSRCKLEMCLSRDCDSSATRTVCQSNGVQDKAFNTTIQVHHEPGLDDENVEVKKCPDHQVRNKEFACTSNLKLMQSNNEKLQQAPERHQHSSSDTLIETQHDLGGESVRELKLEENEIPSQIQLDASNCDFKTNEVDASDHNYIKKAGSVDCNSVQVEESVLPQESCLNKSEHAVFQNSKRKGRKIVDFRNSFLHKTRRSYRRRRHKNVKRLQLIPRQSKRNKEGVRNQILQQLELLRNRRTSDFGRELHQTIAPGLAEPLLYKKRLSNEKAKNETSSSSSIPSAWLAENDSEIIEEVQGPLRIQDGTDSYMINPTKTKDITKIKGWKHKKFVSLDDLNKIKRIKLVSFATTPTCSYKDEPSQDCKSEEATESATSAFASNNLDGFLDESADLHISFQIPKLASGEGCGNAVVPSAVTVNTTSVNIPPKKELEEEDEDENVESTIINGDTENLLKIHKITNLYKPRTVAQRKRIWRLKNDSKIKQDDNVRKPRTLAEKRRLMDGSDDSKNFIPAKRSASETNFFDEDLKYSYVLYRGKKLRVPTSTEKGVIAYVKYTYNKKEYIYVPKKRKMSSNKNKPSIFNINSAVKADAVKYRPGPLCKKLELQEENKIWRTVIKKLPKVYLNVTPEINRPLHPSLLRFLPNYQFEMTPERIEFALSVVYDRNQQSTVEPTTYRFPLAYANHEESLLFREKITVNEVKPDPQQDGELITDVVKNIIDKMLDYVETKDVAEDIFIKEDVNVRCRDEEITMSSPATPNLKRKPKKSKTNYELKRLNVKVIEVDLEDKGDVVNCNKDYCKLGCICKSLATTSSLVSNHCGIPDCMFECTCNYDRKSRGNLKITLPVGIDVLSEGAVSRLEDEAKKNLAKVEKEFTQTVIQANNQTIVVGGHCNRQRRLTKTPRKYNDFIDDPDFMLQNEHEAEENYEPSVKIKPQPRIEWRPCVIKIPKLKLEQLIPFCLVHNLHNCHCDYKAQFKALPTTSTENAVISEIDIKKIIDEYSQKAIVNYDCQSCARTRGISTSYYVVRNRTQEFILARKKKLEKLYKEYIEKLYKGEEIDVHAYSEVEVTKMKEKDENIEIDDKQVSRSTRRKQQLTVREDNLTLHTVKRSEPKKAKQKLKPKERNALKLTSVKLVEKKIVPEPKQVEENKKVEQPAKTPNTTASELNNVVRDDTLPKLDNLLLSSRHTTELLTPSTAVRTKFLQLLGKKNECDAQFRLMPWSGLAGRYESGKLQLWYSSFYKVPKIIVTDSVIVPRQFTNVKQFESIQDKSVIKVDLIRWLVTKTVPGGKKSDDVLVILQLTKTHCEVCGICEKTCINSQSSENMLLALIPSFITQSNSKDAPGENKEKDNKDKQPTEIIEANTLFNFETIDDQKKQHVIAKKIKFSKCKYPKVVLQETENIDSSLTQENTSKRIISTYLPHINKNSQWRMIQLNSDFSILSLLRNSYAIKYSDLLRIVRMAQATYTTIVLKTPEVEQNYPHPDFGLFAAPNCEEKIFIGPYFYYESHDVSTLRYVNRVLVKTELFNQMKGKAPTNNGCWLKQVQGQAVEKKNLATIDLTLGDSDNETEFIETQGTQENSVKYTPSPRSLLKQPFNAASDREQEVPVNNNNNDDNNLVVTNTIETTIQEKLSSEKSIFTIDDVANFEMSAVDFEVKDNSGDCDHEDDNTVNVRNFENQLYLIPNVPLMGYILAHKLRTVTIVRWPTLNNAKRFYRIEEAVLWLEKELSDYFIVPPNFRITIKVRTELTQGISEPFDPKYLKGYYLATKYGIKSLLNINVQTLQLLEVTSKELELLARRRAKKMIYDKCCEIAKQFVPSETLKAKTCSEVIDMITSEIKTQRKAEVFYIDKQQKLLSKKERLVNNLSSVIKDISPYVSNKTQTAMLDILKRHKTPSTQAEKPPEKNDVVCITIDSDEETSASTTDTTPQPNIAPPTPVEMPPLVIPKISVRNLHDLRDPSLNTPLDNTNTIILTKKKKSEVPRTLRVKNLGVLMNHDSTSGAKTIATLTPTDSAALKTNLSFETKFEKIHLFPFARQTTAKGLAPVSDASAAAAKETTTSTTESSVQESKSLKRKLRPIFPSLSKCVIKAPTGKLIKVNADQLKNIQKRSIFLAPVVTESSPQEGGMTVITNHSSHGGFVKINLDDAVSTQLLRTASESSSVQSSGSS